MHKNEIKKVVKKLYHSAKKALIEFNRSGDQEQLHRFRAGVKKLRALACMVCAAGEVPHLERTLRPVRKTFQVSGEIRDDYRLVELGKGADVAMEYLDTLQTQMELNITAFKYRKQQHLKRLRQFVKSLIKGLRPVKKVKVNLFYEQQLRTVADLFAGSPGDDKLHTGRKKIKILLYNLPLSRHALKVTLCEDYLDKVQAILGDWHDMVVAAKTFPALRRKADTLRKQVQSEVKNFYTSSTAPNALVKSNLTKIKQG